MAETARSILPNKEPVTASSGIRMANLKIKVPNSFFYQFWLLLIRNFQMYVTKSVTTFGKFVIFLLMAMMMTHVFDTPAGLEDGCKHSDLNNVTLSNKTSTGSKPEDKMTDISRLMESSMYLFVNIMFYMFMPALTIVIAFPSELKTVSKEISNSWYGTTAYYNAKFFSDFFILFICILPSITYTYTVSKQPAQLWRFGYFLLVLYLMSCLWQSRGVLFSIVFNKNETMALLITLGIMYPDVFLSGFYAKTSHMPSIVRPITYVSDMKRSFESLLVIVYGYGRCPPASTQNATNGHDEPSFMLAYYDVKEDSVTPNILFLAIVFALTQVLVYVALRYTMRVSKL